MAKNNKKETIVIGQGAALKKIVTKALISVAGGAMFLIATIIINLLSSNAEAQQLNATKALNQYRIGSKTLTYSVQSLAVTGKRKYYENYMKELDEEQLRENALATLHKLSINNDEWDGLNEIASLSDGLVPLEKEAIENALKGNTGTARGLVFSEEYEDTVDQINTLTNEVINKIQDRKARLEKCLA